VASVVVAELPPNMDPVAAAPPKIVDELVLVTPDDAFTAPNGEDAVPPNGEALGAAPPPLPPNILVPPPELKPLVVVDDDPPNTLAEVVVVGPPKLLPVAAGLLNVFPPNIPDAELVIDPPKMVELWGDWVDVIVAFVIDDCAIVEVTLADVELIEIPGGFVGINSVFVVPVKDAFEELEKIPEVGVTLVDDAAGSEETIEAKADIEPLLASEDIPVVLGLEMLVLRPEIEETGLVPNIPCAEDGAELKILDDPPPNSDLAVPVV